MALAWKVLIPLALFNLLAVMVVEQIGLGRWASIAVLFVVSIGLVLGAALLNMQRPRAEVNRF
jgi:hypothetical protein